ncbi:HEAT repeat protein [Luteibacter jiangsuensis]|uniref:HEAT repeat protein n=1 Tax=Luteibacter jiangsuensis TaxID=637577 RepID=A0ABT9SXF7_9GAMM|nr:hypothetical protein [Luteibacter jiangsuensis]MDQ0009690.1 HEAT repeat protein [Luteibacter jiangsuensis]
MNVIHALLTALLLFANGYAVASEVSSRYAELEQQRLMLVHSKNVEDARTAAIHICTLVAATREHNIASKQLMDDLAQALDSDDEGVSYFAVRSLALIGSQASSSLPAMRKLLDKKMHPEAGTLILGISAIPQIENAIDVIEGKSSRVLPSVSERCDVTY